MTDVLPFVATRYATLFDETLAQVLTPPYDVIDDALREALYARDEHNFARIDCRKEDPADEEAGGRYAQAGRTWDDWKRDEVLVEDTRKAFYVYEQVFELETGSPIRRRGFFAAVRLQDFSEGGIRAHESTFDGPKADRFQLMRSTHANLSPVFCIYDDETRAADILLARAVEGRDPDEQCVFDGVTQRVWAVTDPEVVRGVGEAMAARPLMIADGHHRYETSLLYRDKMREATDRRDGRQSFDYTLMFLANTHDEGLVVLPAHRVLSGEACVGVEADEVLEGLNDAFDVTPLELDDDDTRAATDLTDRLARSGERTQSFVLLMPRGRAWLLALKEDADLDGLIGDDTIASSIKRLDVTILHHHLIGDALLGNPEIELDEHDIDYVIDAAEVVRRLRKGRSGAAFLLNPTRVEQVVEIAGLGLRMPHKSTYFYPKLVTGLVMRDFNSPW